jgi:hypothetical protein
LRFSLISPYEKLDQKILGIFDAIGDLTIFTWGMPEIEIVYSDIEGKHHVSSMPLEKYDHIASIYPFDCDVIAIGNEPAFDESIRFFEKAKGKNTIFFINYDDLNFYSLYRGIGGMQNIDEIMALSILDFGIYGKKLIQIVKDNESEEVAKELLEEISLMNYLLKYSAGCLVTNNVLYNDIVNSINSHVENSSESYLPGGIFALDENTAVNLKSWLIDEEHRFDRYRDDFMGFQFIIKEIISVLDQKEYQDMLTNGVIRDMVRDTMELLQE